MDTLIYIAYNSLILWKSINTMTGTMRVTFEEHVYEVPHSLLEFHPGNILTQAASEQHQSYPEGIVVLKGDGSLFKLILSFLQDDGGIILPSNVSKSSFLNQLTFYGIKNIDATKILSKSDLSPLPQVRLRQGDIHRINSWDVQVAILVLAKKCATLHIRTGGEMAVTVKQGRTQDETITCSAEMWKTLWFLIYENFDCVCEDCNRHLFKVGLKMISVKAASESYAMTVLMEPAGIAG